ncbi:UDP-glucosyltransferase 2 [Manduca sexta]|uniref:UDP-glucuronosyltransferase n=1 Tax=Manduca sexta TaxID=7130 RepID=A0A921ZM81_MANSE|nr:UDP-glucosyltransferase 2 [Manduca sexta]KAG6460587.1 UDP-glycosyltransferase [Manduca sexta]
MCSLSTLLFLVGLVLLQVDSARILCVFPFPAVSHQNVFHTYNKEHLRRGHELVVISPNPMKDRAPGNITEIDISHTYKMLLNLKMDGVFVPKRGVITTMDSLTSVESYSQLINMMTEQFNPPEVKKLIAYRHKEKFDLIVVEALPYMQTIYAHLFNAPLILFSSLHGVPDHFEVMGAVSRHPTFYPYVYRHKHSNLNFFDKIQAVYDEFKLLRRNWAMDDIETEHLQRIFGKDALPIQELKNRAELLFLTGHAIIGNNRPVPPNVIYLGSGIHLKPVKPLPEDLQAYLDDSKRGVVYVSLGTNVPTSLMDEDLLNAFLTAFARLPYDVLWKLDENNIPAEKLSKNIKIGKWFPQRDMLMHPNIKAFVTQGGAQSTDEAFNAKVPLVGIPMLGDQWYNTNKYVELRVGVKMDSFTMNADDLYNGIMRAVNDPSFRENLAKLRDVLYDSPQTALEKAVWWTEFVLRHKGAKHLRSPGANKIYTEYFMIDFIFYLGVMAVIAVVIVFALLRLIVKRLKIIGKEKKQ